LPDEDAPDAPDDEDDEELALLLDDDEESSESAAAVQGAANNRAPTPSAAASPPTRPMCCTRWSRVGTRRGARPRGVCSRCLPVESICNPLELPAEQAA
ncbi:MAG: hypothetical protein U1D00_32255, partial [Mycobacterium sp.]|nr:hypothetical protein [Mycobacterium sp.]